MFTSSILSFDFQYILFLESSCFKSSKFDLTWLEHVTLIWLCRFTELHVDFIQINWNSKKNVPVLSYTYSNVL